MEIETISGCSAGSTKKYCMVATADGATATPKFLIPRKNLVHNEIDNKKIYYGRITDELLRHNRIRSFMFQSKLYLNLSEIKYNLTEREIILLQSAFTTGNYFDGLIPEKYIISFQRAIPSSSTLSQKYKNVVDYNYTAPVEAAPVAPAVAAQQQPQAAQENVVNPTDDYKVCIKDVKDNPIGNNRALWVKRFPLHCKEVIFQDNSPSCSFAILQYIMRLASNESPSIFDIKHKLLQYYKALFENGYSAAISQILKKEGKTFIQENFEYYLISETYYITNFDLWVFFSKTKLPVSVILFSALKLKELSDTFNTDIDWLLLSAQKNANDYVFIRSPTTFVRGKTPAYNLITPIIKKGELRVVEFQNSLNYPQKENSIEIEKYLDIILPAAAAAPKKQRIVLRRAAAAAP